MFRPAMAIIKFFSKTLYEVLYSFCNGVLMSRSRQPRSVIYGLCYDIGWIYVKKRGGGGQQY